MTSNPVSRLSNLPIVVDFDCFHESCLFFVIFPTLFLSVAQVVKERPEDPFEAMSAALLIKSERSEVVLGVSAREVISAAALPALEVTIRTVRGSYFATTAVGPFDGDGRWVTHCRILPF